MPMGFTNIKWPYYFNVIIFEMNWKKLIICYKVSGILLLLSNGVQWEAKEAIKVVYFLFKA